MTERRERFTLLAPGTLWLTVFFLVPLVAVLVYSFWKVENYRIIADPGLRNYAKILAGDIYYGVAVRTFRIAAVVTLASLIISYPVAYFLARKVRRFRFMLLMLIIMPLWTSYLVRTFAWALVLGRNGVVNQAIQGIGLVDAPLEWLLYSEFAVTLALVHIYMPFMVLPIYAVLERFDGTLLEAATDMGASKFKAFLTVTLPLSLPGVVAGTIFVFVPAIGAYVTPELIGGTDGMMFGNLIAQQFGGTFEYPFGSALTVLMVAFVALIVSIGLRYGGLRRV